MAFEKSGGVGLADLRSVDSVGVQLEVRRVDGLFHWLSILSVSERDSSSDETWVDSPLLLKGHS